MFWKFGFHNASSIDTLLDNDDVSLEAILDEDDLLQECKSQNTRLIDYFRRADVLQRLLGYVTGDVECENKGRLKYSYVATEVLCSDIWSIVETCLNQAEHLLKPFWDSVLDRSPEDMYTQNLMASQFAKINSMFLTKKPAEMLAFIESQKDVVERILRHLETPAFSDLLFRIIQQDEYPTGAGVLQWLSKEKLIPRLVEFVSPSFSPSMHSVASDFMKGIISIAAPSPGAGLTEGNHNGPASNLFARQLAQRSNISKLIGYMLDDFSFETELANRANESIQTSSNLDTPTDDLSPPYSPESPTIPNIETATSSGVHAIGIIVELIRKNNSDYFEPYLFHTIRNRLIQIQQSQPPNGREALEFAMLEMVERMGVVHLGPLLEMMSERLEQFQKLLHKPRSPLGPISTTIGQVTPLTFERFRICELYAELLHCSNMSLLNRSSEFDRLYDASGRLQGGLASLEELARVIALASGNEDQDNMDAEGEDGEPAHEFPVSSASNASIGSGSVDSDEDDDMSDDEDPSSSDDDVMEEIAMSDEPMVSPPPMSPEDDKSLEQPPLIVPSSPNAASLPSPSELAAQGAALGRRRSSSSGRTESKYGRGRPRSNSSRRRMDLSETQKGPLPIGDILKRRFIDTRVLTSILDLFFAFPWNNFLHSTVYDVIHQILTGRVDSGLNRELIIALFRDGRLMHRIVEGQTRDDRESHKTNGLRLGYMGHLTLISEDVIGALQHFPPDLRLQLAQYAPRPDWDDYVSGRYQETKKRDTSLLGGGKPVMTTAARVAGAPRWKVDEADAAPPSSVATTLPTNGKSDTLEMTGEFRRTTRVTRENSADFGVAQPMQEEPSNPEGAPQFAQYLAQQMASSNESLSDGSDDEDEDNGGWLTQSKFDLGPPPVSARNQIASRQPLSSSGFEDAFNPTAEAGSSSVFDDHFGDEDDSFGPFSDAAASNEGDPFMTSGDDVDEGSFETFAEFGEFHGGEGELTPTGDSWTFASVTSISSGSSDADLDDGERERERGDSMAHIGESRRTITDHPS
ncbi:SAPS-domain-containing protein [Rickenella mellea]|uniref:SAPS-domain-containing protein n=1 Tax=Rickenella mellea TaxID=50990 RepID=A0A4Y7QBC2_9AGAM|nr:SAPS-domain-containing protein [Rickenella mellea]